MKALSVGLFMFLVSAVPAHAITFSFHNITNNDVADAGTSGQYTVDVEAVGANQVSFTFNNAGPSASFISDIYFDDGTLLGIASVTDGTGTDFDSPANNENLPGGNSITPPFQTTQGFSAQNEPGAANGVNPGEEVTITFDLKDGQTFADTLTALGDGSLRIGIHVQGFEGGGSESFVNNVPEPGTLALLGSGLVSLGWLGRKRLGNVA